MRFAENSSKDLTRLNEKWVPNMRLQRDAAKRRAPEACRSIKKQMHKPPIIITKLDAARRQIDTAIALYFCNGDFISIHTLAYAAFSLVKDICDKTDNPASFTRWVKDTIHPDQHDQVFKAISSAGNYFKHADRDHEKQYSYIPLQYEYILFLSMRMYDAICGELTSHMTVFKVWYMLHYPKSCSDEKLRDSMPNARKNFPENKSQFFYEVIPIEQMALARIIEHVPPVQPRSGAH